ncbi:MAG: ImmA/IrrE family metallo-endopeptidase [Synergistaceae bacterium]|jgi:Zn-dependent peptidase ImmA (M78 family)|nr:ImmA/IrrE family metallo-endopeptidase [Synergistaceae bacterium]
MPQRSAPPEEQFDFPDPPERIPEWAQAEAEGWRSLHNFDLELRAERLSGLQVEIRYVDLPVGVWGLHIARGERARLCVNSRLPGLWRRFALFHELYHLIRHSKGERFWQQTFQPMSKFESEADLFAWAIIWPEWSDAW